MLLYRYVYYIGALPNHILLKLTERSFYTLHSCFAQQDHWGGFGGVGGGGVWNFVMDCWDHMKT